MMVSDMMVNRYRGRSSPVSSKHEKAILGGTLTDYALAFHNLDTQRVLPYYHEPLMLIGEQAAGCSPPVLRLSFHRYASDRGAQEAGPLESSRRSPWALMLRVARAANIRRRERKCV